MMCNSHLLYPVVCLTQGSSILFLCGITVLLYVDVVVQVASWFCPLPSHPGWLVSHMHPMIASAHAARKPQPTTTSTPEQFPDRRCRHREAGTASNHGPLHLLKLALMGLLWGPKQTTFLSISFLSPVCVLDTTSWRRLADLVPLLAGHAGTPTRPWMGLRQPFPSSSARKSTSRHVYPYPGKM